MISSAGYIDALVLQPGPGGYADYLKRRIEAATDEDHKTSLLACLEEYRRLGAHRMTVEFRRILEAFERTRRPLKIVVNAVDTYEGV